MTIPGIGYTIAAIILAEISDINNFSSPAKLLAFAGMEPSTYQSGKYNATSSESLCFFAKHSMTRLSSISKESDPLYV